MPPKPGALQALPGGRQSRTFNADERAQTRENTPVTIGGVEFTRRRKDWAVSRLMRKAMRDQEKAVALNARLRSRIVEHEVNQAEAARDGNDELETELEAKIEDLVERGDAATEAAELVTYRLLALLLKPPADRDDLDGWGPEPILEHGPEASDPAVAFLQPALDVEDAAALAGELTGSDEPDPPTTTSSEDGSS